MPDRDEVCCAAMIAGLPRILERSMRCRKFCDMGSTVRSVLGASGAAADTGALENVE